MKISPLGHGKNLLLFLLASYSLNVQSAAILISDGRSVEGNAFLTDVFGGSLSGGGASTATGQDGPFSNYFDSQGVLFDLFDTSTPAGVEAEGSAGQNSTVSTTSFTGTLNATGFINDPNNLAGVFDIANGEAFYIINFELLTAHTYTLDGTLSVDPSGSAGQVATLTLGGISLSELDATFSLTGILQAGTYQIAVAAEVFASPNEIGHAFADFDLQLTEVPVPATVWLLGSGMFCLFGFMRKNTRL